MNEVRFHSRINRTPTCWLWTGAIGSHGYGNLATSKGVYDTAHRIAYRLWVGEIPDGQIVCHACDVRRCVNPAHLFLGSYRDNTQDAITKGRFTGPKNRARGERSGKSKLTDEQVRAIRADTRRQVDIAAAYGISQNNVSCIKRRATWAHVED